MVRVIDVSADTRLDQLREILQVAVGWTDSHVHQFIADEHRYGIADADADPDEVDETTQLSEDCSGPTGYSAMLTALSHSRHPDHADLVDWTGDRLVAFDREAVDDLVRDIGR